MVERDPHPGSLSPGEGNKVGRYRALSCPRLHDRNCCSASSRVRHIGTVLSTWVSNRTRRITERSGTTRASCCWLVRRRSAISRMRWTPRLSRYVVCDRSTTRPGAVLGTTAMSWARQSATLARSISPSGAATGTPLRSITLTIAVTIMSSPAFVYAACGPWCRRAVVSPSHGASAPRSGADRGRGQPARRAPASPVAHGHLHLMLGHLAANFDVAICGSIRVLDDVAARFAAGHQDLVGILVIRLRRLHPPAQRVP